MTIDGIFSLEKCLVMRGYADVRAMIRRYPERESQRMRDPDVSRATTSVVVVYFYGVCLRYLIMNLISWDTSSLNNV